jgi:organic hydroperoxide reductase OsmC/OhrA
MHVATVKWEQPAGKVKDGSYSRAHNWHFDGGAIVVGSSSPSVVPVPQSDASAVDPEEALVASVSSCHMLWFLDLANRAGFTPVGYVDEAKGKMERTDKGKFWISKIDLYPVVDWDGDAPNLSQLEELHHKAHENCFIANSVKSEVETHFE